MRKLRFRSEMKCDCSKFNLCFKNYNILSFYGGNESIDTFLYQISTHFLVKGLGLGRANRTFKGI